MFPAAIMFEVPSTFQVRADRLRAVTADALSAVASAVVETASAARGSSLPAVRADVLHTLAEADVALRHATCELMPHASATDACYSAVRNAREAYTLIRHASAFTRDTFRADRFPLWFNRRAEILDGMAASLRDLWHTV